MADGNYPNDQYYVPRTPQDYCREMARFLHDNPGAWTQGTGARRGTGEFVHPTSPHARAWCMLGLINRFVYEERMQERVIALVTRVVFPFSAWPLHAYNDMPGRTVQEVERAFDMASRTQEAPVTLPCPVMPDWKALAFAPPAKAFEPLKADIAEQFFERVIMQQIGKIAA